MTSPLDAAAQAGAAATGRSAPQSWRALFPALDQRVGGKPLVYLDSAATTQRALPVLDEIMDFYRRDNANPGCALHELARRANERYENARRTLATFINAATPAEVVWTRGTTEGINLVATAWGRSQLRRGDEVLLTMAEHASNLLPWRLAFASSRSTTRVESCWTISIESYRSARSSWRSAMCRTSPATSILRLRYASGRDGPVRACSSTRPSRHLTLHSMCRRSVVTFLPSPATR